LLLPFEPFAKIVVDDDVGVTHGSLLLRQAVGGGRPRLGPRCHKTFAHGLETFYCAFGLPRCLGG
jgi:hypothetical protein